MCKKKNVIRSSFFFSLPLFLSDLCFVLFFFALAASSSSHIDVAFFGSGVMSTMGGVSASVVLVAIDGGAIIAQRVAAAFVLAVVVNDLGFDFAFAGKAAAWIAFLAADADAGVEAVLYLLDDLVNVDRAAAVIFVDDLLGALIGSTLGAMGGDDGGGPEADVKVGGGGVQRVGDEVDGSRQGPVGVVGVVVVVSKVEVVDCAVGLALNVVVVVVIVVVIVMVCCLRSLCGRAAAGGGGGGRATRTVWRVVCAQG